MSGRNPSGEAATYRRRLRAAEQRIAELEDLLHRRHTAAMTDLVMAAATAARSGPDADLGTAIRAILATAPHPRDSPQPPRGTAPPAAENPG